MVKNVIPLFLLFLSVSVFSKEFNLTILHTNDLHSHFEGSGPDHYFSKNGTDQIRGNYARLSTLINRIRQEKEKLNVPTLLIDAGDFFSGTLFHIIAARSEFPIAPELEFFLDHKYDLITLGNHEFDGGEKGLLTMLQKVEGKHLPLISSNLYSKSGKPLPILNYKIKTISPIGDQKEEVKIGLIGVTGKDAALVSRGNRKDFEFYLEDDLIEKVNALTKHLKENEKVDLIILSTHAGDPEDKEMAKNFKDVNVIISGHAHDLYQRPYNVNGVIINQAGCYGYFLGKLDLTVKDGAVKLIDEKSPTFIPVTSEIPADEKMVEKIENYKKIINLYLEKNIPEYRYDTPIFTAQKNLIKNREEVRTPLGLFVTSGILEELNNHATKKVDAYFTSLSQIREDIRLYNSEPTLFQFSDIFRVNGIGMDEELNLGSPIVSFYLTKSDLRKLIDTIEIYKHISSNFTPAVSDTISYEIRWWGIPFLNRLKDLTLYGKEYKEWPELINLATTKYVAHYLYEIDKITHGLVQITVRDGEGKPLIESELKTDVYPKEFKIYADFLKKNGEKRLSEIK